MKDKDIRIEKDDNGKVTLYIDGNLVTELETVDKMTASIITDEDMTKLELKIKETLMKAIEESVADKISIKNIK